MKDRQTKAKPDSAFHAAGHLIQKVVCLGAIVLICTNASAQNLFMSDGYSGLQHNLGHIYKFTPRRAVSTFASGLDGPEGLAFDIAGNLYVTSFLGRIYKFTPGGARTTFASGLNDPMGLAFDSADNLYVADEGSGHIYKFRPNGVRTTFASGLSSPRSLTFNLAGKLFVACVGSGNIYKFQPNGVRTTFASGLSSPYALAFDGGGNLFVTGWGNGSSYVFKYTWNGLRTTFARLKAPLGLAFDRAGNLLVMDENSCKIYKYTPNAVRTVFAEIPGLCMDQTAISPLNTDSPILFFTIRAHAKGLLPGTSTCARWNGVILCIMLGMAGLWQTESPTSLSFRLRKQWLESQRAAGEPEAQGSAKNDEADGEPFGFIDWLHSLPRHLSNVSILIDTECKNIQTLSACAGVHKDLVPLSAPQAQRSLTFF